MTGEKKQEYTRRIAHANETGMVVILYEILLEYLKEAKEALRNGEQEAFEEAVRKCRNCFNELLQSVNPKYELGVNLNKLYFFCLRELASGLRKKEEEKLVRVEHVIEPLCRAYAQIAQQNENGPVMNNSQNVYAGLTYGKGTLVENLADQGSNRGMLV